MLSFVQAVPFTQGKRQTRHVCLNTATYGVWQQAQLRLCPQRRSIMTMSSTGSSDDWSQQLQESVRKAEEATKKYGKGSKEAAAAWDAVEELNAEASHQRVKQKTDPLEKFCDESPEADECRVYDN